MMKTKVSFRKRRYYSVVVFLSLFAVCSNSLHAVNGSGSGDVPIAVNDSPQSPQELTVGRFAPEFTPTSTITYNKGALSTAIDLPQTQVVAKGETLALSNMGAIGSFYKLVGWNTMSVPLINSMMMENIVLKMGTFYALGDPLIITQDTTLYAVWVIDQNNDGKPDYAGNEFNQVGPRKVIVFEEDEMFLRRGDPGYWFENFDRLAFHDTAYYVGCTYNADYDKNIKENMIILNPKCSFDDISGDFIKFNKKMIFVVEYGGVLTDGCMIGGEKQEPLSIIEITQDMVNRGFTVDSLINRFPFKFSEIKEDGQGILKMYFLDSIGGKCPLVTDWNYGTSTMLWEKPFIDLEKNLYTDVLTIKFNIYNKPVFKSNTISQFLDNHGNLDFKQVSGTPLKYMMRSIDGFGWRPADSPLSGREQGDVRDGASICLRELDRARGYQTALRDAYRSRDIFYPDNPAAFGERNAFREELESAYNQDFFDNLAITNNVGWLIVNNDYVNTWLPLAQMLSPNSSPDELHNSALLLALLASSIPAPDTYAAPDFDSLDSTVVANWDDFAENRALQIPMPDACREMNCLVLNTIAPPAIQREVGINTIAGVTSTPDAGKHYVNSREDFPFTLTFSGGQPLKVIATRVHSQLSEELQGTDLGGGMFSYVIRQVQEAWNVTVLSEPATDNEVITGTRVWTSANTLYINSDKAVRTNIYTLSGTLFKQVDIPEGTTSEQLERGVYIVEIDGSRHKVVVK